MQEEIIYPDYSRGLMWFLWDIIRTARPANNRRDIGRAIEYILRLVPFLYWVNKLRAYFSSARLDFILYKHPPLLDKVRRPYQDRRWGVSRRTDELIAHYRWLRRTVNAEQLAAIYGRAGWKLAEIDTPAGVLGISLLFDRLYDKEGELMMALLMPDGQRVATLAFSVGYEGQGVPVMRIAGLQGEKDCSQQQFVQLTKACQGLRPLALLVNSAQCFAGATGIREVYGISAAHHVYRHWRYRFKSIHRISRSYDELWQEMGGEWESGWYRQGSAPRMRDLSDIPSRKRAMYTRRYALIGDLQQQMNGIMGRGLPQGVR